MEIEISPVLQTCLEASFEAGKAILEIYNQDFEVAFKADESPLTLADQTSHQIISRYLAPMGYPILSEEGKHTAFEQRQHWSQFWLVDPLDGTKEFVKKNGEFTTNIAFIDNGRPVLGVIYAPVLRKIYWAELGKGAFMAEDVEGMDDLDEIYSLDGQPETERPLSIVGSRSHMTAETLNYLSQQFGATPYEMVSVGSSLKFCMMAEGQADHYPRLAPTMEWDTAAGQVVAECCGFEVLNFETKQPLVYNKSSLVNPWFIVQKA